MGKSMDLAVASPAGAALTASGLFLAGEGVISMLYSQDQQTISNVGRLIRIGIGGFLLGTVYRNSR
jgi:hypothetical protein